MVPSFNSHSCRSRCGTVVDRIKNSLGLVLCAELLQLSAICACLSGCAGEQFPFGSLEGKVNVGGQGLPHGTLNFTPLEDGKGPTVTAEIQDGRYSIKKVPLGKVRVVIHAMKETGKILHDRETGTDYPEMQSLVPRNYQISGVEIVVAEGSKTHDFDLSPK